jgi:hypothetical protein
MPRAAALLLVSWVLLSSPKLGGCSRHSPTTPAPAIPPYELVTAWGDTGTANGQFWGPHGAAADRSGKVYVAEWNLCCRVQKFAPRSSCRLARR